MFYARLIWTQVSKNFLIILQRHALATAIRAFVLPVALMIFLAFAKNLFVPAAYYGIALPSPVMSLHDGLLASSGTGRDHVVFVNSGFKGGEIERVIDELVPQVQSAGRNASVIEDAGQMPLICKSSLRGVSPCYGAVIFTSSPSEGSGGFWNYTIRLDSSLGVGKIDTRKNNNDGETYLLPLQRAIDVAITGPNNGTKAPLPATTEQYPFTALTQTERDARVRQIYQGSIQSFIGVAFIAAMVGVCYHLTGFMATERESGISTLIDSMLPVRHGWQAQAVRLFALHVSFDAIYLPGWIIASIILARQVFANTNVGIVLILHILTGLSLSSFAVAVAALFRRSQLSGVTVTLVVIVFAILAQSLTWPKTATVTVLSLLFPSCNYTFFITYIAAFEAQPSATNLTRPGPGRSWSTNGIVLWVFLIIQIIVYPFIGAWIERSLHGSTSGNREVSFNETATEAPVQLDGFTKIYKAGFIRRIFSFARWRKDPVIAVNGLSLRAGRGQILALLGANGSGKSTTLDSIAGTQKLTSGSIRIDGSGGIGIAPQKNVLWDELTVAEHILIFNRLKTRKGDTLATKAEILQSIRSVDLENKAKAQAKTLSGGQKRKLQLGIMLTGGTQLCLIDEVSSGLDPISRRKIWDIILAERGRRTMIMTTHFLDEADLLADQIAILSKGSLRAEGTSVALKERLGAGYRIRVPKGQDLSRLPEVEGVTRMEMFDMYNYVSPSSSLAAQVIRELEHVGIRDYRLSGPTIEDVFLKVAEEVRAESDMAVHGNESRTLDSQDQDEKSASKEKVIGVDDQAPKDGLELLSGRKVGFAHQARVLFHKRMVILKGSWYAYVAAFILPVAIAGFTTIFIKGQSFAGCSPTDQLSQSNDSLLNNNHLKFFVVAGPPAKVSQGQLVNLFLPIIEGMGTNLTQLATQIAGSNATSGTNGTGSGSNHGFADFFRNMTIVNTYDDFNNYVSTFRKNVTPAGIWLGDSTSDPTLAYTTSQLGEMFNAWFGQWTMNMLLSNTTIASQYQPLDIPWAADTGNSLQLLVYLGLALAAYPGFFALYPNLERRRMVRSLEYSNGVRPLPLWLAYVAFDFTTVLLSSAVVTIIYAAASQIVWWHVSYIFLILMLYGLVSIQIAYIFSIWASNQLSAYAFTAAYQAVGFLVYLIAYLCTITYAPVNMVDHDLLVVHFVTSAFVPIGNVIRTMFLELNLFSATCVDNQVSTTPGGILQ
jgi:ATP-binding cassette, subfamily A (ABC1), member 3